MVGRFSRSRQGYGFVRPSDAGPTDRDADIRVPLVASADAADGDTVRVKITKERHVGIQRFMAHDQHVAPKEDHTSDGTTTSSRS